ncbi:MAG: hypothetical protein GWM87_07650, partial [Xanthomonadales bacterium]|nr:hypothetical protein [Xanthomonadales bacterium]NIX12818.1 hypothetical protein [Xanthomonadales bacterium]
MRITIKLLFTLVLLCCAGNTLAKELVAEFKGSEGRYTPEFEVRAPWILD